MCNIHHHINYPKVLSVPYTLRYNNYYCPYLSFYGRTLQRLKFFFRAIFFFFFFRENLLHFNLIQEFRPFRAADETHRQYITYRVYPMSSVQLKLIEHCLDIKCVLDVYQVIMFECVQFYSGTMQLYLVWCYEFNIL